MALTGFADIAVSDSFIRFNLQTLSYLYVPFSVLLMLLIIGILYLKRDQVRLITIFLVKYSGKLEYFN